jgi:hypothetical protein
LEGTLWIIWVKIRQLINILFCGFRRLESENRAETYTRAGTGAPASKKVIELQRAIVSLCVWTRFCHIRKDHAFSCWMISSCQMDKKWANTNPIKNVSQNRICSTLRVGSKTIENEPPLVHKLMNFTSINDAIFIIIIK